MSDQIWGATILVGIAVAIFIAYTADYDTPWAQVALTQMALTSSIVYALFLLGVIA